MHVIPKIRYTLFVRSRYAFECDDRYGECIRSPTGSVASVVALCC